MHNRHKEPIFITHLLDSLKNVESPQRTLFNLLSAEAVLPEKNQDIARQSEKLLTYKAITKCLYDQFMLEANAVGIAQYGVSTAVLSSASAALVKLGVGDELDLSEHTLWKLREVHGLKQCMMMTTTITIKDELVKEYNFSKKMTHSCYIINQRAEEILNIYTTYAAKSEMDADTLKFQGETIFLDPLLHKTIMSAGEFELYRKRIFSIYQKIRDPLFPKDETFLQIKAIVPINSVMKIAFEKIFKLFKKQALHIEASEKKTQTSHVEASEEKGQGKAQKKIQKVTREVSSMLQQYERLVESYLKLLDDDTQKNKLMDERTTTHDSIKELLAKVELSEAELLNAKSELHKKIRAIEKQKEKILAKPISRSSSDDKLISQSQLKSEEIDPAIRPLLEEVKDAHKHFEATHRALHKLLQKKGIKRDELFNSSGGVEFKEMKVYSAVIKDLPTGNLTADKFEQVKRSMLSAKKTIASYTKEFQEEATTVSQLPDFKEEGPRAVRAQAMTVNPSPSPSPSPSPETAPNVLRFWQEKFSWIAEAYEQQESEAYLSAKKK